LRGRSISFAYPFPRGFLQYFPPPPPAFFFFPRLENVNHQRGKPLWRGGLVVPYPSPPLFSFLGAFLRPCPFRCKGIPGLPFLFSFRSELGWQVFWVGPNVFGPVVFVFFPPLRQSPLLWIWAFRVCLVKPPSPVATLVVIAPPFLFGPLIFNDLWPTNAYLVRAHGHQSGRESLCFPPPRLPFFSQHNWDPCGDSLGDDSFGFLLGFFFFLFFSSFVFSCDVLRWSAGLGWDSFTFGYVSGASGDPCPFAFGSATMDMGSISLAVTVVQGSLISFFDHCFHPCSGIFFGCVLLWHRGGSRNDAELSSDPFLPHILFSWLFFFSFPRWLATFSTVGIHLPVAFVFCFFSLSFPPGVFPLAADGSPACHLWALFPAPRCSFGTFPFVTFLFCSFPPSSWTFPFFPLTRQHSPVA